MKLTTGNLHSLFVGLIALEDGETLKLTGDVRLKIAINRNLIEPYAAAYERARNRVAADLMKANRALPDKVRRSQNEIEVDLADVDVKMREKEEDVEKIKTLLKSELRLEDNLKITGAILAQIMPILDGVE